MPHGADLGGALPTGSKLPVVAHAREHSLAAAGGQRLADRPADAAVRAGDQRGCS